MVSMFNPTPKDTVDKLPLEEVVRLRPRFMMPRKGEDSVLGILLDSLGDYLHNASDELAVTAELLSPKPRLAVRILAFAAKHTALGCGRLAVLAMPAPRPMKRRKGAIGFDSIDLVPPHACLRVTASVQDVFEGRRLVIPAGNAWRFSIDDARTGTYSNMCSMLGVPGDTARSDGPGFCMEWKRAQVGQQLTLSVRNDSDEAVRFTAVLEGDTLEYA